MYIEDEDPSQPSTYRSDYPKKDDLRTEVRQRVTDFALHVPFEDLYRDTQDVCNGLKPLYDHKRLRARPRSRAACPKARAQSRFPKCAVRACAQPCLRTTCCWPAATRCWWPVAWKA